MPDELVSHGRGGAH